MSSKLIRKIIIVASLLLLDRFAAALEFPLPSKGQNVIGQIQKVTAKKGDSLSSLGVKYNIGYYEMVQANPELPRNGQLSPGEEVIRPSLFILPSIHEGLVINLAELRAYFFPTNQPVIYTFPVGAGREGWSTPQGKTKVVRKKEGPTWVVPQSIMNESIRHGKPLKKSYPPGPNNPLGKYAIYLDLPGIRLHGTNAPASIGRRASHGCIRLLADDIKFLYENVPVGTLTQITYEPSKVGWKDGILYLEEETPFRELENPDKVDEKITRSLEGHPGATVDWQRVNRVVEEQAGVPTAIGHDNTVSQLPPDVIVDDPAITSEDANSFVMSEQQS